MDTATAATMVADAEAAMRLAQFERQAEVARRAEAQAKQIGTETGWNLHAPIGAADAASLFSEKRLDHLSDSPTDPRNGAAPHPGLEEQGEDPPPDDAGRDPSQDDEPEGPTAQRGEGKPCRSG